MGLPGQLSSDRFFRRAIILGVVLVLGGSVGSQLLMQVDGSPRHEPLDFSEQLPDALKGVACGFGGMGMGNADIGEIEVFHKLREVVEGVPNVKTVVPMGISLTRKAMWRIPVVLGRLGSTASVPEGRR